MIFVRPFLLRGQFEKEPEQKRRVMEFFEGKRVRELRGAFEAALDATLEPPSTRVSDTTTLTHDESIPGG